MKLHRNLMKNGRLIGCIESWWNLRVFFGCPSVNVTNLFRISHVLWESVDSTDTREMPRGKPERDPALMIDECLTMYHALCCWKPAALLQPGPCECRWISGEARGFPCDGLVAFRLALVLGFWGIPILVSVMPVLNLHSHMQMSHMSGFPVFHILTSMYFCLVFTFLILAVLTRMRRCLRRVLVCIVPTGGHCNPWNKPDVGKSIVITQGEPWIVD